MTAFAPILVEHHAHGETGPRLRRLQRAEMIGDALGQHRHHAVREIDGIAAGSRFLVERASGLHVGGDVGDGDHDHPTAFVPGIGVGLGPHRVVAVAGVHRVESDEGQMPQILAAFQVGLFRRVSLAQHRFREGIGNAVGMNGDEARRPLILRIAEPVSDAGIGAAEAGRSAELEADKLAVLGVIGGVSRDAPLFQLLAVDGIDDTVAAWEGAEDAELAPRGAGKPLDRPRLVRSIGVGAKRRDARQNAIADAGGRPLVLLTLDNKDARRWAMLLEPVGGPGDELAVGIALDDLEHGHGRQHARALELAAGAGDQSVVGHVAQQLFQSDAVAAFDAEGARDLALAGLHAGALQKVQESLAWKEACPLFGIWERSWSWPRLFLARAGQN